MIEKYCNFEVTAMKILVKSNQRYYDNCELLDYKMVGLGGLTPPTSPLSVVRIFFYPLSFISIHLKKVI